jgi:diguanylate cyclase (GGDEF)-like protein
VAGAAWTEQTEERTSGEFGTEAAVIAAAVSDGITRMDDLTIGARAKIVSDPVATNGELRGWYRSVDGHRRFPFARGFGYIESVPAARLSNFIAAVQADPVPGIKPAARFRLVPPGRRSHYCLVRLAVAGEVNRLVPGYGYDVCALPGFSILQDARDSGRLASLTEPLYDGTRGLIVVAPVYWSSAMPRTLAARRNRIRGWITGVFDIRRILAAATAGAGDIRIVLQSGPRTIATFGRSVAGQETLAQAFPVAGARGWRAKIVEIQRTSFFSPPVQGAAVAAIGTLVTALAFALVQLLLRGRARALRLVDQRTDELRHQALHDALTGLPNRTLIVDRATQMLTRASRRRTPVAALFLDLDGFKIVNDTFGHPAGDELLRSVAERIRHALRDGDTVGRLGGDEFVVLLEGDALLPGAEFVAERLLQVLREPFVLRAPASPTLSISASIGIATGGRSSANDLLRDADIALYQAKMAGKDCYASFRQEMHTAVHDRLMLENDLRGAVERGELVLEYQPIFDLGDGRLNRVEALVRWNDPARGLLQPHDFVPVAEETGLILGIGDWVLREACEQAAAWHANGHPLDVAVNVSVRQMEDANLCATVRGALESSGLPPSALILEFTETGIMRNAEQTVARLSELRSLGLRIAIDDFGTGYSSLAYLQQFPVDSLKIDRSFVAGIGKSAESKALIHTLVQLGASLGLTTIAEGIEDAAQLELLKAEHCDKGQGFLFARPLPAAELSALLAKQAADRPRRLRHARKIQPRPLEA